MIIFIGSRRQTYLLRTMQRDERMPAWTCQTYQWLFRTRTLPAATYIFVGVDRLDAGERRLGGLFYRHINGLGAGFRALNDPATAMGRYRLLRTLYEQGINDFNVYLVAESARPERWPVFIRRNGSSTLPLTELLHTPAELGREIDRLIGAAEVPEDMVIIEYCSEEFRPGIYRKQSEYRVADRYVPTPTIYAGSWMVKVSNTIVVPDELTGFDSGVLDTNPYAEFARRAFEIAGIEYGRADIGLVGERPQIYEINFNPDVKTQRERPNKHPVLSRLWDRSDTLLFAAMTAAASPAAEAKPSLKSDELDAFRWRFWRNYAPQRY